jgi:hypothetical protein
MGNRRLNKIERFHVLAMPKSERLKVAALNLFHRTASPLFQKVGFFHIMTEPLAGEGKLELWKAGLQDFFYLS